MINREGMVITMDVSIKYLPPTKALQRMSFPPGCAAAVTPSTVKIDFHR